LKPPAVAGEKLAKEKIGARKTIPSLRFFTGVIAENRFAARSDVKT
jgi:hypothetical protein